MNGLFLETGENRTDAILLAYAERRYDAAITRSSEFPELELTATTWMILLYLFIQNARERLVSVTTASEASNSPSTTALRHITQLVERGHVERVADPFDRRRSHLHLSDQCRHKFERLLRRELELDAEIKFGGLQSSHSPVDWNDRFTSKRLDQMATQVRNLQRQVELLKRQASL